MKMDNKTIIGLLLCFVFYVGYNKYLQEKYGDARVETPVEPIDSSDVSDKKVSPAAISPAEAKVKPEEVVETKAAEVPAVETKTISKLSDDELTIETKNSIYKFDQNLSGISSLILKNYKSGDVKTGKPMNLVDGVFSVQAASSLENKKPQKGFNGSREGNSLRFWRTEGPWEVSQVITVNDEGYGADIEFTWKNVSQHAADLNATVIMHEDLKQYEKTGGLMPGMPSVQVSLVAATSEGVERENLKSYCSKEEIEPASSAEAVDLKFIGFDRHYFLKALIPTSSSVGYSIDRVAPVANDLCPITAITWQPQGMVEPNKTITLKYKAWFGPKVFEDMKAYYEPLSESLNVGWFGFISHPLFLVTKTVEAVTNNWGWAIILVTLVLKLIFFPLNKQAAVSMARMKKLQPEMNAIREKYKDDKVKQQQEIMQFMSLNKINPMKGCLPMLPQVPVFFAFYRMLSTSIELRHAPFVGWITDLSTKDPYYITPILLGVAMFAQQKLNPTPNMDKAQAKMMLMLPLVFTVMMLSLPAGMVLYMLVNTVVSVGQQQWFTRRLV